MSSNYFRNLKKQQPIDNRPKYLRYGDVFISSKNNINRQQQRYAPNFSTATMPRDNFQDSNNSHNNNKYKVFDAANIDRIRTTKQINSDSMAGRINPRTAGAQINSGTTGGQINSGTIGAQINQYDDNIDYIHPNSNIVNNNNPFNQQIYNDDFDDNYSSSEAYDNFQINSDRIAIQNNNGRVNYKKRQLPPLQQRYSSRNSQYDLQYDNQYWDDYDPYQSSKTSKKQDFKLIWQKFIITFTSILSIVCIAWIAYHWHSNKSDNSQSNNTPEIIEPDKPSFKVLPDVPGGIDIPYQDKSIYNRVDPTFHQKTKEQLRIPQEVPSEIPMNNNTPTVGKSNTQAIEEYSIVDERDYYVKCPIDGDKNVAVKQLNLLKKKLSTFPDSDMLENTTCAIRTVANTSGQKGKFILIGPFCDDNTAKQIGHFCKIKGEIISVKKVNKN